MKKDLINILSNSNKDIGNQHLMDYLAGKLSAEEKHEIEQIMIDNDFLNDAVEGLEKVKNKKNIETLVQHLNKDLQKKLAQKKIRKEKRKLREYPWVYFTIILILIVAVVAYFMIRKLQRMP
jgi:hypothetical protein